MTQQASGAAPVTSSERIGELDVLRGFALLGVLVANLFWFSLTDFSASFEQMGAYFGDPANEPLIFAVDWLVSDKANTTFATLFGIGFWVQMQRIEQAGGAFATIYLRRLAILMLFGLANILLIWPWDILFIYSVAGLLLFALRKLPARVMFGIGALLIFARPLFGIVQHAGGFDVIGNQMFTEATAAIRNQVFVSGTYSEWVAQVWDLFWIAGIQGLEIPIWIVYALGRFMIGASIVRAGWLDRIPELLPQIRRVFWLCLPLGLLGEAVFAASLLGSGLPSDLLHAFTSYLLAFAYGTGLVLFFNSPQLRSMVACFAPVGRMALTNYMVQGVFIGFLLYGFHGGLALAGTIQPVTTVFAALLFFIAQVAFSHLWLARYRFGPLEWLWRALTYGKLPELRRQPA